MLRFRKKSPMSEVCYRYHRWDYTGLVFVFGCYHETDWKCNLQDNLRRGHLIFPNQLVCLKFNWPYPWIFRNRCSSVDVSTQLYTWRRGVQMSLVARDFSSPKRQDRALRPTKPPIYCLPELFPGVKRPGHEVNHPHLSRAEVKNAFIGWTLPFTFCLLPCEFSDNSWYVLENLKQGANLFWLHITGWVCCTDLQRLSVWITFT
jgi:hypothetical protein